MTFDELKQLDPRDPGRWPLAVRIGAIGIWFVVLAMVLLYFLVWNARKDELAQARGQQAKLQDEFKTKHAKAVNLELYKQQLKDIERSFGAMLRQLPGKTEVPNLLVDISQTGLAAGLQQEKFQPQAQITRISTPNCRSRSACTGSYHQLGEFVSGIAALPRIVTLHDVVITPANKDAYDQLQMDVTAKTYRYLDDEEIASAEAARKANAATTRGSSGA